MRGRGVAKLVGVVAAAAAMATAAWLTRAPSRLQAGPVRFEFVNAWGNRRTTRAQVLVNGQVLTAVTGVTDAIDLPPGEWEVTAAPWGKLDAGLLEERCVDTPCGDLGPLVFPAGAVPVDGSRTEAVQTWRIAVGPRLSSIISQDVSARAWPRLAGRTVSLQVWLPDGGAAAGAQVLCEDELVRADDDGRARCGPRLGGFKAYAGTGPWGAALRVSQFDRQVEVPLVPAMQLHARLSGADAGPSPGVTLVFTSKGLTDTLSLSGTDLWVPGVPAERTSVCAFTSQGGGCDLVVPPAGGGIAQATIEVGAPGQVTFRPVLGGQPLSNPVVYLDRHRPRPLEDGVTWPLAPGRHVLVVNPRNGPQRYEACFEVRPGETTDLGEVWLEEPAPGAAPPASCPRPEEGPGPAR